MYGDVIREFMENTSLHGLKFLVEKGVHWSERIFWVVCLIFSWYGSTLLIIASWDAFKYHPISFVVETTYTDWNTDFPSVVVCETENNERIEQVSDHAFVRLWTSKHDFNLEEVLKEIAFYKGVSYYMMQYCSGDNMDENCPKGNFTYYVDLVRSSCEDIFSNCTWNDDVFDCCEYFQPIDSELGTCYGINSIQGRNPNAKKLKMISNKLTGPGMISMNVHVPANIYINGEEEVPALTSLASDILSVAGQINYKRHMALRSIENDLAARDVSVSQRQCKYPDESPYPIYRHHSYSACTVQCRRAAQLAACNCTNFLMPNTSRSLHCDVLGLRCLHRNYGSLSVLRAAWGDRDGLYCDCQPSCTEVDISVIADDRTPTDYAHSYVQISLDFLPTERFRRNVVRGPLDLVVSVGGTAGLFLGASILSFVELPYFFVVRGLGALFKEKRLATTNSQRSVEKFAPARIKRFTGGVIKPKNKKNFIEIIASKLKQINDKSLKRQTRNWTKNPRFFIK